MKPLAVYTIARNESFFLPRWLDHYSKLHADVFVLDHESDDGSTSRLGSNRIKVYRPHSDDVGWMLQTVEHYQRLFLKEYHRVIFTEVDEFLVADPERYHDLQHYLNVNEQHDPITATGFDVCQRSTDQPLDPSKPIMSQRGWKQNDRYSKTLISRKPLSWEVGFHKLVGQDRVYSDVHLLLVHFHYADLGIAWDRLCSRMHDRDPFPNNWGAENKERDYQKFWDTFAQMTAGSCIIPERFQNLL